MATATEMLTTWEDQVLETVQKSQDIVLKAVNTWAEAGGKLLPKPVSMPYSDELPTPAELVERYYRYSVKLLNSQKDFVNAVLDAAAPVLNGNGATAPASKR
jgi:hypothetical protein